MTHFAPRKGIFALILVASFCLHILLLVFSSEKAQYDTRQAKGNQILNQLSNEVQLAMASQDKVSLSVIVNRYQNDPDIAKLAITDAENATLVQTGQAQTQTGHVLDKTLSQNNQLLGHMSLMMKEVSKGEIISSHWSFLLGSAIIHGFLWLLYGWLARPTAAQLQRIGEKVQQRLVLSTVGRGNTAKSVPIAEPLAQSEVTATHRETEESPKIKRDITDFLQQAAHKSDNFATTPLSENAVKPEQIHTELDHQPSDISAADTLTDTHTYEPQADETTLQVEIRFFDEFNLLDKIAPEVALPYFQLCQQLLGRTVETLFSPTSSAMYRQISRVRVAPVTEFTAAGAVLTLVGKPEQLPLAAVLLAKLFIILNQVVYEKHRELSRFALPMRVGASPLTKADDLHKLLNNHAKSDSILLLLSADALKTLQGQVQLKNQLHPMSLAEREMVWYAGMSEYLITQLIEKRNQILALD